MMDIMEKDSIADKTKSKPTCTHTLDPVLSLTYENVANDPTKELSCDVKEQCERIKVFLEHKWKKDE